MKNKKNILVRIAFFILAICFFSCDSKLVNENTNSNSEIVKADELHLSDQQVQLGHILTDTVRDHTLGSEFKLTGTLAANQNKMMVISSRVMGRIEKLYFKNTGDKIHKGQALYGIYSEDINLTLMELKLATEKKKVQKSATIDIDKMISSAKNKLMLFGLSASQINELQKIEKHTQTITIKSNVEGIISSVDISEGNYVMEGGNILHIADYSSLWVETQVFSEDISKIKENMTAIVSLPDNSQLKVKGKVIFNNPELNNSSKINLVRIEILNEKNRLKPGMQVNVAILFDKFTSLALPTDAIILEEKGSSVWLQTGHNQYKNIMVHTGIESNGYTQILHGLKKGDIAVVSGNYLLQSEYTFKNGSSTMKGHQH